jgi:hypothetical protein
MEENKSYSGVDGPDVRHYREDYAIIAHKQEMILLVRMSGYYDVPWRLPQGKRVPGIDDETGIRDTLQRLVGCSDIGSVSDTGIVKRLDYSSGDRQSYDARVTAKFYIGKNLHFYLVELLCNEHNFINGKRVDAIQMVSRNRLRSFLHPQEADAVEEVLEQYVLDTDGFFDGLAASLEHSSKGKK